MSLTQAQIEQAPPALKPYKLADTGGLYVFVTPSGGRLFRMDFHFGKTRQTISFGRYPFISLKAARQMRDKAHEALQDGRNPAADKQAKKKANVAAAQAMRAAPTFAEAARAWIDANRPDWSPQYARVVKNRIEGDLITEFGSKRMGEVRPEDVEAALKKVRERGVSETAFRLANYTSMIFEHHRRATKDASVTDPTLLIDRKGVLGRKQKPEHFAKLMGADLGRFMLGVRHYPGERATGLAIKLTALTAARTAEIIGARWEEFEDLKRPGEALWRIPAQRMKAGREHLVPLSAQAQDVLAELRDISKGDFLFPAEPGRRADTLSNNAMLFGAYRMGFKGKTTIHGLRGSFSTITREKSGFDGHVIEMALAHMHGNKTERAYNSAEYLPQRRALLQWWADYLDRIRDEARFGVELAA
ncbi:MAG: tyrosine-type recombinase/integrase [Hyphomonadaceae bacterium]